MKILSTAIGRILIPSLVRGVIRELIQDELFPALPLIIWLTRLVIFPLKFTLSSSGLRSDSDFHSSLRSSFDQEESPVDLNLGRLSITLPTSSTCTTIGSNCRLSSFKGFWASGWSFFSFSVTSSSILKTVVSFSIIWIALEKFPLLISSIVFFLILSSERVDFILTLFETDVSKSFLLYWSIS